MGVEGHKWGWRDTNGGGGTQWGWRDTMGVEGHNGMCPSTGVL